MSTLHSNVNFGAKHHAPNTNTTCFLHQPVSGTGVAEGSVVSSISTYEQTGSAAKGTTTVTLADATEVAVGQSVAGVGVASGTKVGAISGTSLTLTTATTGVLGSFTQTGSTIAPFTETGTFINYYVTVTLANANGAIAVGQTVTGTGIAANTKVRIPK